MPFQTRIPEALARFGLKVETIPGWQTRGGSGLNPAGALSHWTAGPRGTTGRPSLNVCINGRTGLPGPLCNVYLDRNGVAVVVAAGVSNHGGVGTWRGFSGNSRFFGTEAECGGDGDWTTAQRVAYPRVNAAYCWLGGFAPEMCAGHHEYATPAGRKIDIRDWPMSAMRSQVAALLANPQPPKGFLMALSDAEQNEVRDAVRFIADQLGGPGWRKGEWGWPDWRFPNGVAADDVKLTLLDYVRSIDRQANSGLDLENRPGGDRDNELGHLLSLRAELRGMLARIEAIVVANRAQLNVEVSSVADPTG